MTYKRVSKYDLRFRWNHKHLNGRSSFCEIVWNDIVLIDDNFTDCAKLFDELTILNPEQTVAIGYNEK